MLRLAARGVRGEPARRSGRSCTASAGSRASTRPSSAPSPSRTSSRRRHAGLYRAPRPDQGRVDAGAVPPRYHDCALLVPPRGLRPARDFEAARAAGVRGACAGRSGRPGDRRRGRRGRLAGGARSPPRAGRFVCVCGPAAGPALARSRARRGGDPRRSALDRDGARAVAHRPTVGWAAAPGVRGASERGQVARAPRRPRSPGRGSRATPRSRIVTARCGPRARSRSRISCLGAAVTRPAARGGRCRKREVADVTRVSLEYPALRARPHDRHADRHASRWEVPWLARRPEVAAARRESGRRLAAVGHRRRWSASVIADGRYATAVGPQSGAGMGCRLRARRGAGASSARARGGSSAGAATRSRAPADRSTRTSCPADVIGLGYVEQAPLPLLDALERRRTDGRPARCWSARSTTRLHATTAMIERLGFIEGCPLNPRVREPAGVPWGLVSIGRITDRVRWRHLYPGAPNGRRGDEVVALGSAWAHPLPDGVELRRSPDGWLVSELAPRQRPARPELAGIGRWVAAPHAWAGRPRAWAARASLSRLKAIGRHTRRAARRRPRRTGSCSATCAGRPHRAGCRCTAAGTPSSTTST